MGYELSYLDLTLACSESQSHAYFDYKYLKNGEGETIYQIWRCTWSID